MISLRTSHALVARRTAGAEIRYPKPLRPGQIYCPVCRKPTALTATGKIRGHNDLFGWHCYNTDPPVAA